MKRFSLAVPTASGIRHVNALDIAAIESGVTGSTLLLNDGSQIPCTASYRIALAQAKTAGIPFTEFRTVSGQLAVTPNALSGVVSGGESGTELILKNGERRQVNERFLDVLLSITAR